MGFWLTASACLAAPPADPMMSLGRAAPTPVGFIAFCERQPLQCGDDRAQVLLAAASAAAGQGVLAAPSPAATETPRAIEPDDRSVRPLANAPAPPAAPVEQPPLATPPLLVAAAPAVATLAAAEPLQPIALTSEIWSKLNRINAKINRSMIARTDEETYGVADYWDTPFEEGRDAGDCEDFALEKRRALIEAGVPARALNIALVITDRGESHAVLLISTRDGDFVLDNLSPWIRPWNRTDYRWIERQVDGNPFKWAMIDDPARVALLRTAMQREITRSN